MGAIWVGTFTWQEPKTRRQKNSTNAGIVTEPPIELMKTPPAQNKSMMVKTSLIIAVVPPM
jgi:hypothetical protein